MAKLDEVVRAGGHTAVDVLGPRDESLEICSTETESVALSWIVHVGGEVDVIDLGVEVELASAQKETTGHPVDVGVLQEVGSRRPLSRPGTEPNHLLTATKVVDYGGSCVFLEDTAGIRRIPRLSISDCLLELLLLLRSALRGNAAQQTV